MDTAPALSAAPKEECEKVTVEKFYANEITKVLFTEDMITAKLRELGAQITKDYQGQNLIVVGLLRGALIFLADLVRHINLPVTIDVMTVKSYSGTASTGTVKLIKDLDEDPTGKHILIAEDLIDTGNTLVWLSNHLKSKNCASVKLCCLLNKQTKRRKVDVPIHYTGFNC